MLIKTDYIGDIEVDESEIYSFDEGVYGFPESKRFVFIGAITAEFPFIWMQSVDDINAVFIVTNPFAFIASYDFELNEKTVSELDAKSSEDILLYSTVVIPEHVKNATINLKAPIVVNVNNRRGRQIILTEDYPYKYPIFEREA